MHGFLNEASKCYESESVANIVEQRKASDKELQNLFHWLVYLMSSFLIEIKGLDHTYRDKHDQKSIVRCLDFISELHIATSLVCLSRTN